MEEESLATERNVQDGIQSKHWQPNPNSFKDSDTIKILPHLGTKNRIQVN